MPHTSKIVDELCFIKSMYTEEITPDPAVTFIQSIDWAGTVNNILNNLSALGSVFIKILGVYWDLLPDILKSALMKAWDLLKTQLGFALEMFKSLASFVWEPLKRIQSQIS